LWTPRLLGENQPKGKHRTEATEGGQGQGRNSIGDTAFGEKHAQREKRAQLLPEAASFKEELSPCGSVRW
jgi:hypothetical protein